LVLKTCAAVRAFCEDRNTKRSTSKKPPVSLLQERLALSSFMTGGAMGDVTSLFREAFYRYNSMNPLQPKACVRLATRSMLLLAEYSKQHGLYAEAHAALMKAQSQVSHD